MPISFKMTKAVENQGTCSRLPFLKRYRRITTTGKFIPEIDGLRFLAVLSVYIYHLAGDILRHTSPEWHESLNSNWLFSVTQILNVGVPLFFVLSGFILSLPFADARRRGVPSPSLKKYFLRRITRLEPPYILCLLLFFSLKIAAARGTAAGMLPHLIASIFYAHNFSFGEPSTINIVAWSLEVEVQFYILAPLLTMVFAPSKAFARRSALIALMFLTTGISRVFTDHGVHGPSLLGYLQYFVAGFMLTELYLSRGNWLQRNVLWDLVALAGWPALLFLSVRGGSSIAWLAPWLILVLFVSAFRGVAMNRFIVNPWITTIGGMCYTIYLLHNYIIASLGMVTEKLSFYSNSFSARLGLQFLIMSPVILIISGIYFYWIERPCMRPEWPSELRGTLIRIKMRCASTTAALRAAE